MTDQPQHINGTEQKPSKRARTNSVDSSGTLDYAQMEVGIDSLTSNVERHFLELSGRKVQYGKAERVPIIEVASFPLLGKLTALRFVEWVQANPGGVISLPTGKTPEHFIKWVTHILKTWDSESTQQLLQEHKIDPSIKPNMKSLYFVQMDDFYPMDPTQHNSFHFYVSKYYIQGFGLDPVRCLLIDTWTRGCPPGTTAGHVFPHGVDLSLRHRQPKTKEEELQQRVLVGVDEYCGMFESRIRSLGGIGFFMGGIGPDGHIAFNIRGSDHHSTTRLTPTNYETQAAAAGDLGGIELARKTLVVTIGLGTITHNPRVVAIVAAAGEAKAPVIANTVTSRKSNEYPGSVFHGLVNARFYLSSSACVKLEERMYEDFTRAISSETLSEAQKHRVVIDLALKQHCRIQDLTRDDLLEDRFTTHVVSMVEAEGDVRMFLEEVVASVTLKMNRAMVRMSTQQCPPPTSFMHTGPHHDDIMLGYLPFVVHLVRPMHNSHTFNIMTSGFNSVTNDYVMGLIGDVRIFLPTFDRLFGSGYFDPENKIAYHHDLQHFLDGVGARDDTKQREGLARRVVRIMCCVFGDVTSSQVMVRCDSITTYLTSRYPGQKDTPDFQKMKGMIRETEEDLLWGYFGFNESVNHMRLGFYQGNYFTETPTVTRDVEPILHQLRKQRPQVVTVAFDPEGSGPDTHYKVMQAVCAALKLYHNETGDDKLEVWGYRNVWYRFHPADADIMVPVSLNSMAIMHDSFTTCYGSQRNASFPAHEYDGPFSGFAQKIQADQLRMLKTCMGSEYFENSPSHLLKRTHGLAFLKVMTLKEFFDAARDLAQAVGPDSIGV